MNQYKHKEENISNELDPKTVFTTTDAEMAQTRVTQCKKHKWQKKAENELYCPVCQSGAIINPKDMKLYVN